MKYRICRILLHCGAMEPQIATHKPILSGINACFLCLLAFWYRCSWDTRELKENGKGRWMRFNRVPTRLHNSVHSTMLAMNFTWISICSCVYIVLSCHKSNFVGACYFWQTVMIQTLYVRKAPTYGNTVLPSFPSAQLPLCFSHSSFIHHMQRHQWGNWSKVLYKILAPQTLCCGYIPMYMLMKWLLQPFTSVTKWQMYTCIKVCIHTHMEILYRENNSLTYFLCIMISM